MPGALEIDKAAHKLMNFIPVKQVEKDGYSVFYHEERLYSVRHIKSIHGMPRPISYAVFCLKKRNNISGICCKPT